MANRRTFVQRLAGLPFLALGTAKTQSMAQESGVTAVDQEIFERKYLAVRALRLVNTAELWQKNWSAAYASISDLGDSKVVEQIRQNARMETAGMGRSLLSMVRFEDFKHFLPGWELSFTLADDSLHYISMLTSSDKNLPVAFSTDEGGRIYQGKPIEGEPSPSANERAAGAVAASTPIKSAGWMPARSRLRSFIRNVAFVQASPDTPCGNCGSGCRYCCQSYPCCCGLCCSCQSGGCEGMNGINCGCSCIWCCCIY